MPLSCMNLKVNAVTPADPGSGRRAVILQPFFLPWRGTFDLLSKGDSVIMFDTVQYVRRSWQNRNMIAGAGDPVWLTVPVKKHAQTALIQDIEVAEDPRWRTKILESLRHTYHRAPYFADAYGELEEILNRDWRLLRDLCIETLAWGFRRLGKPFHPVLSSSLPPGPPEPVGRLVHLCQQVGATRYLSGPAAQTYIGEGLPFRDAGITLEWMHYEYPDYPRLWPGPSPRLSAVDLIFHTGPEAARYVWPRET